MSKYGMTRVGFRGDRIVDLSAPKPTKDAIILAAGSLATKIEKLLGRVKVAHEALSTSNEPATAEASKENK